MADTDKRHALAERLSQERPRCVGLGMPEFFSVALDNEDRNLIVTALTASPMVTGAQAWDAFVEGFEAAYRIEKPDIAESNRAGVRAVLALFQPPTR